MQILGQRNYPGAMLGNSGYSLARYGCTTTDITMFYNWIFGKNVTPAWMSTQIEYNSQGMILWTSLSRVGLKLVSRVQGRNDAIMSQALKNPIQGCLIQVDGDHWVFGLSKAFLGGYNIADPWFCDKSTTARYKQNITGCAIISKL